MRDVEWYEGSPPVVPRVELDGVLLVVCPFCDEVHMHAGEGIRSPGCGGPRAQYEVRGLAPVSYVRLLLSRLGFERHEHGRGDDKLQDAAMWHLRRMHALNKMALKVRAGER